MKRYAINHPKFGLIHIRYDDKPRFWFDSRDIMSAICRQDGASMNLTKIPRTWRNEDWIEERGVWYWLTLNMTVDMPSARHARDLYDYLYLELVPALHLKVRTAVEEKERYTALPTEDLGERFRKYSEELDRIEARQQRQEERRREALQQMKEELLAELLRMRTC